MIPSRHVTDALHAHLSETLTAPVGDHTAPNPAPSVYHVLEPLAGSTMEGLPVQARRIRYRVRTVAVTSTVATSRQAAEHHADQATHAILSRSHDVHGDGWEIGTRRIIADSGPVTDSGPAANVIRDYELWVAPADVTVGS